MVQSSVPSERFRPPRARTIGVYLIHAAFSWKLEIDVLCTCGFLVNISIKVNFHLC